MKKKQILKILREVIFCFVNVSEIFFKTIIYFLVVYICGYTFFILSIDSLISDIILITIFTGGLWWSIKDYLRYVLNRLNKIRKW